MNLLEKIGLVKRNKPNISLHANCMVKYADLVHLYLSGADIVVLNPNTDVWEDCPNPVFDPSIQYKLKDSPVKHSRPIGSPPSKELDNYMADPLAKAIAPLQYTPTTPATPTTSILLRGQIWEATAGSYLVLGNKHDLVPNYNPSLDPDGGPIVVVRVTATKDAVSARTLEGLRKDRNPNYSLVARSNYANIILSSTFRASDKYIWLYAKKGGKTAAYLDAITGEIKIRPFFSINQ